MVNCKNVEAGVPESQNIMLFIKFVLELFEPQIKNESPLK